MADMTYEELEEKMLDILEEVCGDDEVRTNRDEDLFALGLLDSMGAIELLVDIEEMNTVDLIIHQVEIRL